MPYVGGKLEPWFGQKPTERALYKLADRGGEHLTRLTRMNTPVHHGHLRASWRQKPVVIVIDARGRRRYESGTTTDVDYAPYVEFGTGLWGPKHAKYPIVPRKPGGWLHWTDPHTGLPVFAKKVMHPGSPGNHMVSFALGILEGELPAIADPILIGWGLETLGQNRTGL